MVRNNHVNGSYGGEIMRELGTLDLVFIVGFLIVTAIDLIRLSIKEVTWRDRIVFCMLAIIILLLHG